MNDNRMEDWQIEELVAQLEAKYTPILEAWSKAHQREIEQEQKRQEALAAVQWLQLTTMAGRELNESWWQQLFKVLRYTIEYPNSALG